MNLWNCYAQGILKETRENTKTIFAGSARSLHVRSGDNGIKNIYLDIHDADGKYASIAFLSDGEKAIKYSVNGNVMWRVSL